MKLRLISNQWAFKIAETDSARRIPYAGMFSPENTPYRIQGTKATTTHATLGKRLILLVVVFFNVLTPITNKLLNVHEPL
jgi:hypothetical protein